MKGAFLHQQGDVYAQTVEFVFHIVQSTSSDVLVEMDAFGSIRVPRVLVTNIGCTRVDDVIFFVKGSE